MANFSGLAMRPRQIGPVNSSRVDAQRTPGIYVPALIGGGGGGKGNNGWYGYYGSAGAFGSFNTIGRVCIRAGYSVDPGDGGAEGVDNLSGSGTNGGQGGVSYLMDSAGQAIMTVIGGAGGDYEVTSYQYFNYAKLSAVRGASGFAIAWDQSGGTVTSVGAGGPSSGAGVAGGLHTVAGGFIRVG